ncbi:reverse transcriptase [Tanacetum coccineum]
MIQSGLVIWGLRGRCRAIRVDVPYFPTRQDRAKEVGRIASAFTNAQGTMEKFFHGLYHMLAEVRRGWNYHSGGGSILEIYGGLLDGVVQDHEDRFELLHEFSSPNGRAKGEGECTVGALSSALSTGKSPFKLVMWRQPLTPNALAALYAGTAKKIKKWADERRRHVEFEVRDQVMVKLLPQQFKSLRKVHKGLIQRYEGPFSVIGRVGKQVGKRKTYCGSLRTRSRDITRMARRGRHELRWEKVLEALGSPWKLMEDLEASCRRTRQIFIIYVAYFFVKIYEVVRAYDVGSSYKKGYAGTLPLCDKFNLHHHYGPCPVQCGNYKKVSHQARDCWTPTSVTCYECGEKGHTKKYCLELENQNGAGEACQDPNVVTGLIPINRGLIQAIPTSLPP